MSHLYIHIPFCHSKCPYCDFFSLATKKWHSEFVQALIGEMELRKDEIKNPLQTIYFGGGTPSLLTEQEFSDIISAIHKYYAIEANAEVTLEANPDDITPENLSFWKSQGVNRISIGVQSFDNNDLKYLGRKHDAARAHQALTTVAAAILAKGAMTVSAVDETLANDATTQLSATLFGATVVATYAVTSGTSATVTTGGLVTAHTSTDGDTVITGTYTYDGVTYTDTITITVA